MNWKNEAINDLRTYKARKLSVDSIKERIRELEQKAISLKSIAADAPVQGGASRQEERLIGNIAERERLTAALDAVQHLIDMLDSGLAVLSDDERKVLEMFYIDRPSMYVERLCDELHCEKSTVYRIKDTALYKFTLAMYGVIDL